MWIGSTRAVWHPLANKMVNVADQFPSVSPLPTSDRWAREAKAHLVYGVRWAKCCLMGVIGCRSWA